MRLLRKENEYEPLTLEEQAKLKEMYDEVRNSYSNDSNSFDDLSLSERQQFVFDYYYEKYYGKKDKDLLSQEEIEELIEIRLFGVLLHNKSNTIRLSDFYEKVYSGILPESVIEQDKHDRRKMQEFFEKLNGCVLEETVADIDFSEFSSDDYSSIKIDFGTYEDPLLFVKSLVPVEMKKLDYQTDGDVTIIVIPDLHLDKGCYKYDENGCCIGFDSDKFEERLIAFNNFKKDLIAKMKEEGVKIDGIVFTGDMFDFCDILPKLPDGTPNLTIMRNNLFALREAVIKFGDRKRDIDSYNYDELDLLDDDGYFIAFLAGNHDIRVGREFLNSIMHSLLGDSVIDLGNDSSRIKISSDYISFVHHNSLDWMINNGNCSYEVREARNKATFHLGDYFAICKSYYGEPGSEKRESFEEDFRIANKEQADRIQEELLKFKLENPNVSDEEINMKKKELEAKYPAFDKVSFLMNQVNEKLKHENPKLYYYFLPYIIPKTEEPGSESFFRCYIEIKDGELELNKKPEKIKVDTYRKFVSDSSGSTTFIDRLSREVKDIGDVYGYDVIPQFGRNDIYTAIYYSLSHFHADEPILYTSDDEIDSVMIEEGFSQAIKRTRNDNSVYMGNWKKPIIENEEDRLKKEGQELSGEVRGKFIRCLGREEPYFIADGNEYKFEQKEEDMLFCASIADFSISAGRVTKIVATRLAGKVRLIQGAPYYIIGTEFIDGKTEEIDIEHKAK